jgi:hypothetical protein
MGYSALTICLVASAVLIAAAWAFKDKLCPWWPSVTIFDLPHPCPCCARVDPDPNRGRPTGGGGMVLPPAPQHQRPPPYNTAAMPVVMAEAQQPPVAVAVPVGQQAARVP